jgi:hypothetical protein
LVVREERLDADGKTTSKAEILVAVRKPVTLWSIKGRAASRSAATDLTRDSGKRAIVTLI